MPEHKPERGAFGQLFFSDDPGVFGEQKGKTEAAGWFFVSTSSSRRWGALFLGATFSEGCLLKLGSQDPWTRVLKARSDLGSEVCQA